jgi:hypothetical protein
VTSLFHLNLKMMKPCQTLIKKKAPKKGREKETRGKDQSSGKQTAQKPLFGRTQGGNGTKQTAQKPLFGGPQGGNGTTKTISSGAEYVILQSEIG